MSRAPYPLKTRIGFALAISLAVIWLAAAYELDRSRAGYLRAIEQSTVFQAQAFAENTLSAIKRLNEILLDLRAYWGGDPDRFSALVQRRKEHLSDLAFQIAVIDEEGYLAYSNLAASKDRTYLGEREHFRVHRESGADRLFISKPLKGKVSGKWSIQFTRPILVKDRFSGVLVVSVSPDTFAAFNDKLHLGAGGVSTIVMDGGDMMARQPGNEKAMGNRITGTPYLMPDAPAEGNFTRVAQVDGIERIYGFYRLPEYKLSFVVGHATEDVLAPYYNHRRTVLVTAALVSAIVVVLTLLLYRSLSIRADVEQRLRDSRAMLRSAVDAIGEAFVIYDQDDRLAYCNEQYREYYGTSRDVLVPGRRFEEIIRTGAERGQYAQAVGRVDAWVAERMAAHRSGNSNLIQRLDDGRWLRIRERKTPEGFIVGFRVDVTELCEAKEAAEAANLAKSQFLATMSHEIRTPMNGVLGMAQLLMDEGVTDQQRIDYARTIYESGQGLLTILNDILDLSKVEAGKVEIEHAVFAPENLLHEVSLLFAELAARKGIRLESGWSGTGACRYRGDPTRLRQILSNLVGNAIKFTPDGGRVSVRAEEAGVSGAEVLLCFYVDDSGVGIPSERRHLLFRPFSQLDASTTRCFGGTGLGLAIAQGLARRMGGDIGVESNEGRGATFWFTAQVEMAAEGDEVCGEVRRHISPEEASAREPTAKRILVVEDVPVNRRVVEAMLGRLGYEVGAAGNGREAVEAISAGAQPYDLVLMDCQMPEMDGFEATRRIRLWEESNGRASIPIVALTAGAFEEDQGRCLAAGMDAFLAKPIDMSDLASVLALWLNRKTPPAADVVQGVAC